VLVQTTIPSICRVAKFDAVLGRIDPKAESICFVSGENMRISAIIDLYCYFSTR
jgi:hypothetical protein